jgi:NAD(P)H-dependent FMN reductase
MDLDRSTSALNSDPPPAVADFQTRVAAADAVLPVTPQAED